MFNKLFSNVEYEVPYLDLGAVKDNKIRSKATKLDALVDGNRAFEYKKTHVLYNNGSYNEYSLKTICLKFQCIIMQTGWDKQYKCLNTT